jgi:hypothetical protein
MHFKLAFIAILIFPFILIAQEYPSLDEIEKALNDKNMILEDSSFLNNFEIDKNRSIQFINGQFTGLRKNECLVICPVYRSTGTAGAYQNFITLFYKTATGSWLKSRFSTLEQEIDTLDLDNDDLPELICHSGIFWMGEIKESTTVYQLKNDNETILYSNSSEDYSNSIFLEINSVASKLYETYYFDSDNDAILEIDESLTIGLVESFSEGRPNIKFNKIKKVLKLQNGKYR